MTDTEALGQAVHDLVNGGLDRWNLTKREVALIDQLIEYGLANIDRLEEICDEHIETELLALSDKFNACDVCQGWTAHGDQGAECPVCGRSIPEGVQ